MVRFVDNESNSPVRIEFLVPSELLEDHVRLVAWPSASRRLTVDADSHGQAGFGIHPQLGGITFAEA